MSEIILQPAMKAVIVNNGKILLLKEANIEAASAVGKYQLVGGRLDPGEHFKDGLLREIKEETGLDVEIGRPFHMDEWRPVIKGTTHHIVATFFTSYAKTADVTLSEEHDDFIWIDPRQHDSIELAPGDDRVIEAFIQLENS